MNYLRRIIVGLASLIAGMWVTLKNMFRRPVTEQYPREKPEMSDAFRSAIALVRFDKTGTHDCVACMQCVNICPSFCITIEGEKHPGMKRKRATLFEVDYSLCSVCGLCIDVCPTDTLTYSKIYDAAGYRRDEFVYDLLEPYRAGEQAYLQQVREQAEAEAAAKAAAAEKAKAAKAAKAAGAAGANPDSAGEVGAKDAKAQPTTEPAKA